MRGKSENGLKEHAASILLATCFIPISALAYSSTLKIEAVRYS
jgi:hypothetical protein